MSLTWDHHQPFWIWCEFFLMQKVWSRLARPKFAYSIMYSIYIIYYIYYIYVYIYYIITYFMLDIFWCNSNTPYENAYVLNFKELMLKPFKVFFKYLWSNFRRNWRCSISDSTFEGKFWHILPWKVCLIIAY